MIEVVVNNPLPVVTREDAFEDTMLLIDMVKQHVEKDNAAKKVSGEYCMEAIPMVTNIFLFQEEKIRQLAMEMKLRGKPAR